MIHTCIRFLHQYMRFYTRMDMWDHVCIKIWDFILMVNLYIYTNTCNFAFIQALVLEEHTKLQVPIK